MDEEALPELRRTRQDGLLLSWTRSLPDPVVRRSPVLSTLSAFALMVSGDLEAVEAWLDDADRALAAGADDEELAAGWADTGEPHRTGDDRRPPRRTGPGPRDIAGTVRHARRALELAGPEDHLVPDAFVRLLAFPDGIALIGLGYSLRRIGRTPAAAPAAGARSGQLATAGAE
jgi:LuxR family maltose regulon positive regulatory protein